MKVTSPLRVSLSAHGRQICPHQLFQYNNGRFIVNEEYELAKRYSPFDLKALCRLVSDLPQVASPIRSINKKEGGFNKALLMKAENGNTVIARIPCRNIVPREYGTASEVAVLKFVKTRSSTPVSDVLAFSSNPSNPVGTEYIILDKSPGIQLTKVWDTLSEPDRVKLIREFAQLESKLASIEFPAYGALYMRDALPNALRCPGRTIDVDDKYVIGPLYHGAWPGGFAADPEDYAEYSGPWRNLSDFGHSLAQQGIFQIKNFKTSYAGRGPHHGSPSAHIDLLHTVMKLMPVLCASPTLRRHSQPVLTHPDFHPGNIFVSRDDPTIIMGVIDWQFTCIMPRFTQVRWPLFLTPPEGYQTGLSRPQLRKRFTRANGQRGKQDAALRTKCYEAALVKTHLESYLALTEPDVAVRQLFTRAPFTYRDGILPLRDTLIKISQQWGKLGVREECPYRFSREEVKQHEREYGEYVEWCKLREHTHQLLHSNDGGWVPPEVDFEETQRKHDKLFRHFLKTKMKHMTEQEARKLWFFRERG
ncbi:hypothetical protein ASPWEDRAFT_471884 [Aspergillus wentii DTO 134E9]|uniref:Altered inheritance of mitochondria protein 9, mitochondrial n=1 Tax=Aspergillus wentii DTO 134E9 TaxID=1073089 RepID=A0A1L9RSL5_ASPWE|nr:uncharacterized protein ASPWEDRAFT_471884 [Aspergillus wentii DTO 134E9]KAI9930737.1 hypothetical protein MW887_011494 [Aspergillus wentii]OJJ37909.1 hypothetical protein ASPWEDRAFT_471884 [Aspergillus wentii DTO 134E9]